jgi:cyclopropane fatty-acyl-phospholipid synthase-like methyltransferase
MTLDTATRALVDTASAPYRAAGRFAYHFARGKLRGDPAFVGILELGLLRNRNRILDLGCGQGLLAAWLLAARKCYDSSVWPDEWPEPPRPASMRGIEMRERDVRRAQCALGAQVKFAAGDIRDSEYGTADAIVILDVLHYMEHRAQERVLARVRAALAVGGVLLLRVGDAAGGIRFHASELVDQVVLFAHEHRWPKFYCRSVRDWQNLLAQDGFRIEAVPMIAGTPFANVLLIARLT